MFAGQVLVAKDRAQKLVDVIAVEKGLAEEKLAAAKPALDEAEAALNTIKPAHIGRQQQHKFVNSSSSQYSIVLSSNQ